MSFADCLKDAQRLGYAEADPTFDIEGHDTAQKLSILASLAFGTKVDPASIYCEGISSIAPEDLMWAAELGYRVKLLGVAVDTGKGIEQRVHPTMVPQRFRDRAGDGRHQRRHDRRRRRAGDHAGRTGCGRHGDGLRRGRRSSATSRAACARRRSGVRPTALRRAGRRRCSATRAATTSACWRSDRPGSAATIARRLAQQGISMELIVQRHAGTQGGARADKTAGPVPVILITYATTEDAVRRALAAVKRDRVISGAPQVIRIEKN